MTIDARRFVSSTPVGKGWPAGSLNKPAGQLDLQLRAAATLRHGGRASAKESNDH